MWTPNVWYMNARKYQSLPEADRAAFDKAVADTVAWYRGQLDHTYSELYDTLKAKGVAINMVATDPFKAKMGPVYERFSKEWGADLVEATREAAAKSAR
jgi:TRAP-type transport system periplasmic protein